MKTFTLTQLARETEMIADAVDQEAATILRHGEPRYVMIRYDAFERLSGRGASDPRRVIRTSETPDDIRALLSEEIASAIADKDVA